MFNFLRTLKFFIGLSLFRPRVLYFVIEDTLKNKSIGSLKRAQEERLLATLKYANKYVPFYKNNLPLPVKFDPRVSLENVPFLTKQFIKSAGTEIFSIQKSVKFVSMSTGGSTGEPLKFRVDKLNRDLSFFLLLRGWKLAGYQFGDKIATFAGGSLVQKSKPSLKTQIVHYLFSFKKFSSYGVDKNDVENIVSELEEWKPSILRGYASAVYLLAQTIRTEGIKFNHQLKAVVTTSEVLLPNHRRFIEEVFGCEVFDSYGLNDGGLSAFECHMHDGYHVDTERALLEVVDINGTSIVDSPGRILATTIRERAMPFIRYETGDLGILSSEQCSCGSPYPLLKSLEGRQTDYLELNGKSIGSPVLTVLMGKTNFSQYQILQKSNDHLLVRVKSDSPLKEDEKFVTTSLKSMVGEISVEFLYVNEFPVSKNGKHKFILKEF